MDKTADSRGFRLTVFAALGLHLLLFAAALVVGTAAAPFSDMFDLQDRWLQYRRGGGLIAYLFDPHNLHRLAYTRALVMADLEAFRGSGLVFVVVAALCLAAAAGLLARAAWRAAPDGSRIAAAAVAAMLALSSVNALDVIFPIDTPYAQAFLLSAAALVAWRPDRPASALVLAALAGFANAVALVLWPALAFAALRQRAWRALALALLSGAVFIALYLLGQTRPPQPFDLLASARYGLVWLGLPWSTRLGGPLIGLVLLPLSAFLILTRGGPAASPRETLAVRLMLFSLGAAAMAVLGRSGFEPVVPMRYALFLTPLHLGLVLLALPWLQRRGVWLLLAVIGALLAQQAVGLVKLLAVSGQIRAALADFHRGNDTPMVKVFVHPDPARARRIEAEIEAEIGAATGR